MPIKLRKRIKSRNVQRFTIWNNFAQHVSELRALGATDDDLEPLQTAAEAVAGEEEQQDRNEGRNPLLEDADLGDLTAPHTCANGWEISPPTAIAKRWATAAMLKVTGGENPQDPLGVAYALLAGLWALKTWGEGAKDAVMQTITGPGHLAELLPQLEDSVDPALIDSLAIDWAALMGLTAQKKTPRLQHYLALLSQLRKTFSAPPTNASSPNTSAPAAPASSPPGPNTPPPSPTASSTPVSGKPDANTRPT